MRMKIGELKGETKSAEPRTTDLDPNPGRLMAKEIEIQRSERNAYLVTI
jgi:hypothetical protein